MTLAAGAEPERTTIAVFDFEALGVDTASALTISDLMRTELTGIGTWDLVEREKLSKVLKELELQRSGLTQIEKAREIGRILNAEKVILGSVGKLGSMYVVQARLVDVETGKTDAAKKVTCNCPLDEILPSIENLAGQIAGETTEEAIVSPRVRSAFKATDLSKMVQIQGATFHIGLNELGYKILCKLNPYVTRESFSSIMPGGDVYVDEFHIDRREVTNGEYKEFCDHTGKPYPPDPGWGGRYANYFKNFPEHPVVNVTWYEAMDFAKWQGKTLPSEAEWELAARSATTNLWTWGNRWEEGKANLAEPDQYPYTAAAGAFIDDATVTGIVDMAGNVSEWCLDNYLTTYYQGMPPRNPKGPEMGEGKSVRGGNWGSSKLNSILPKRISFPPEARSERIGFRCVYRPVR